MLLLCAEMNIASIHHCSNILPSLFAITHAIQTNTAIVCELRYGNGHVSRLFTRNICDTYSEAGILIWKWKFYDQQCIFRFIRFISEKCNLRCSSFESIIFVPIYLFAFKTTNGFEMKGSDLVRILS